jgi:hypothetical protein
MNMIPIEIKIKVDQLLIVLDGQTQHIRTNLERLNELRALVVKRDETSLKKLLNVIQSESGGFRDSELKREQLRAELASIFGCDLKQMTLTRLADELSGEKRDKVIETRTALQALGQKLKNEYLSTMMLLSECARFNRTLLNNILNLGQTGNVTYNSNGSTDRRGRTAFVNLQF